MSLIFHTECSINTSLVMESELAYRSIVDVSVVLCSMMWSGCSSVFSYIYLQTIPEFETKTVDLRAAVSSTLKCMNYFQPSVYISILDLNTDAVLME